MESKKYDDTISTSKQESLMKAIAILKEEAVREEKESVQRPYINVGKTIIILVVAFIVFVVIAVVPIVLFKRSNSMLVLLLGFAFPVLYVCFAAKKLVVKSILLYQRIAPDDLRLSCVFRPSCSEYMLLAIEKYGLIKGMFRGVKRLSRCHPPNGGIDNP